jgi:enoyl-[acyl-carrier-protein] reductase (NADH)
MLSAIMGGAAPAEVSQQLSEVSSFRGHSTTAEDVANAIAFLASSEAAAITGVNLLIDTGLLTGIGGKPTFSGGTAAAAAAAQT